MENQREVNKGNFLTFKKRNWIFHKVQSNLEDSSSLRVSESSFNVKRASLQKFKELKQLVIN